MTPSSHSDGPRESVSGEGDTVPFDEATARPPPTRPFAWAARIKRARVGLRWNEVGAVDAEQRGTYTGWAAIETGWLHFAGDEEDGWMSWPIHTVVWVEWETDGA